MAGARTGPGIGRQDEGTAGTHAKLLFCCPVSKVHSYLARLAHGAQRRDTHAYHQNVPPARFSRFARALFEPRPMLYQKKKHHPVG